MAQSICQNFLPCERFSFHQKLKEIEEFGFPSFLIKCHDVLLYKIHLTTLKVTLSYLTFIFRTHYVI